jgi:deoxyadenosine/deoxycytidine kinase
MGRKNYLHIAVIGNIASGKTTASQILANALKANLVAEPFIDNPFLPLFINDKKRWAFTTELFFLRDRIKQHENVKKLLTKNHVVVDSGMLMGTWVYSRNQFMQGFLTASEWQFYLELHKELKKQYLNEDLVVYIKSSPALSLKRIQKRGRKFEKGYDLNYLSQLHDRLEELNNKLVTKGASVLEFDTVNCDLTLFKNQESLVKEIKRKLKK